MLEMRIEPRTERSRLAAIAVPMIAAALTLVSGLLLFGWLGRSPLGVLQAWLIEPFTSWNGIGEILLKTGPLLLIAQGLAIGFRAQVWNIGGEGQLIVGALAGSALAIGFDGTDSLFLLPAMVVAGAACGAGWAGIAALLRTRYNASEILTTFMLSSVAYQLLIWLVSGPLKDPAGYNFPQSILFSDAALFGTLIPGTRANASLLIGLAATVLAWIFMQRSVQGFRLIVGGLAPQAARYAGFGERRAVWIGLLVGGACAGIAGVGEVAGPLGMLQRNISPGYGFAAIIVAFLGGLHPIGIVFSSLLVALIYVGGDIALVAAEVPKASATIFQGLLLVFALAASLFLHHRVRLVRRDSAVPSETRP